MTPVSPESDSVSPGGRLPDWPWAGAVQVKAGPEPPAAVRVRLVNATPKYADCGPGVLGTRSLRMVHLNVIVTVRRNASVELTCTDCPLPFVGPVTVPVMSPVGSIASPAGRLPAPLLGMDQVIGLTPVPSSSAS